MPQRFPQPQNLQRLDQYVRRIGENAVYACIVAHGGGPRLYAGASPQSGTARISPSRRADWWAITPAAM